MTRSLTVPVKKIEQAVRLYRPAYPDLPERPKCRTQCKDVPRPCPFVGCRYHLYLDVIEDSGSIKYNFPDLEWHQLLESCALDIANRRGHTLEEVGVFMNFERERARQVEVKALVKATRRCGDMEELADDVFRIVSKRGARQEQTLS